MERGKRVLVEKDQAAKAKKGWFTAGVAGVGATSFCSDAGHEMVTSLLPGFVTGTLGGSAATLAVIDGVADALTGLSKLIGGSLASDPKKRGRLARGGYVGTAAATAAIGLTVAIWQVAILRAVAWISRGLRSPARDVILTDLARRDSMGRAFGVERAGDNAGAIAGPLLASLLVGVVGIRGTILIAFIPSCCAAVAISIAIREARKNHLLSAQNKQRLSFNLRRLRQAGLYTVLAPIACFELGNLATTLLILRATDVLKESGWSVASATSAAIIMYAGHNAVAAIFSLVAGSAIDRFGARRTFAAGALVYVAAYVLFAIGSGMSSVIVAFALAGLGIALAEPAESAVVALHISPDLRGQAFGLLGLVQSFGDIGATAVAGILWTALSPYVAFGYVAVWMFAAFVVVGIVFFAQKGGNKEL